MSKNTKHIKERILKRFYEQQEQENQIEEKNKQDNKESLEKQIDNIVDNILSRKNDDDSDSAQEELSDSDDNLKLSVRELEDENIKSVIPYFYIDYNIDSIDLAKNMDYKTLKIDRDGLSKPLMNKISSGKMFDLENYYLVINCWRVLTKSNIGTYSFDTEKYDPKKFKVKLETTIKWGSKYHIKDKLSKHDRDNYSLFRDGVDDFLKSLFHNNVKIFIVSNSHYSFVKSIFEYYKFDKYIEEYFTPSKCGMPQGKLISQVDSFKDGRKINKERMFACIERYIGRLPKN
tara:strand:- start:565 stop:1431 length:867 start_codon:yes stop_codon:yes gene_type:complete